MALQADGWWLRSAITWCKRAAMPESVTDRPTSATEMIFLLSKQARYYYDAEAVKEEAETAGDTRHLRTDNTAEARLSPSGRFVNGVPQASTRNIRNYWLLGPEPLKGEHYAAFPTEIPRRAILAGSRVGDVVLDPFSGAGTSGLVALRHDRRYVGIELNPGYVEMSRRRIVSDAPLLNGEVADVQPESPSQGSLWSRSACSDPDGESHAAAG